MRRKGGRWAVFCFLESLRGLKAYICGSGSMLLEVILEWVPGLRGAVKSRGPDS